MVFQIAVDNSSNAVILNGKEKAISKTLNEKSGLWNACIMGLERWRGGWEPGFLARAVQMEEQIGLLWKRMNGGRRNKRTRDRTLRNPTSQG